MFTLYYLTAGAPRILSLQSTRKTLLLQHAQELAERPMTRWAILGDEAGNTLFDYDNPDAR